MRMGPETRSRRTWLCAAGGALLLALPMACLSPTLPLPPPSRPDVSPPDASGFTSISGVVPSGTTAIAQNLESGRLVGQVTGSTGSYTLKLEAAVGDQVAIWYQEGFTESGKVQVEVPADSSDLGPLGGAGSTEN